MKNYEFNKDYGKWEHKFIHYRRPRTLSERVANTGALADGNEVRGRRRKLVDSWDDLRDSRCWGKNWKNYFKCKKQWMKKDV